MDINSISLALAGITFLLTVIWGAPFIRILRRVRMRSTEGNDTGVLPMGGLLFVVPVVLLTLLLNFADTNGLTGVGTSILLPLAVLLAYALLGGWVDGRQLVGRPGLGSWKPLYFGIQLALASGIAYGLHSVLDVPEMYFPFYKGEFELGIWFFPMAILVIAGTANAFQVTAGVDSLAGLVGATAFASYGAVAVLQEQVFIARFSFTIVGALLGFLWFNIWPAALGMGRAGTYALGSSLATVALMTGQWPLLALIAVVPMLEILSVGLRRLFNRYSPGHAILQAVPLHAHYLKAGWSTTQVVQRFWLVSLLFAMIGFTLALV